MNTEMRRFRERPPESQSAIDALEVFLVRTASEERIRVVLGIISAVDAERLHQNRQRTLGNGVVISRHYRSFRPFSKIGFHHEVQGSIRFGTGTRS